MTKTARGFACISLFNPKTPENVGGVLRAAYAYDVAQLNISGKRTCWRWLNHATNTARAHRHMPVFRTEGPADYRPFGCPIVAVDLVEGATDLPSFIHPPRAMYVFGPEDGTLGGDLIKDAQHVVYVPTRCCMNLAATVNVVLYDRMAKGVRNHQPYQRAKQTGYSRAA